MSVVFSGIQPTGDLHLGNYIGAISQWVALQNKQEYNNIYCIVDLHAITIYQDPKILKENTLNLGAFLLACGLDINKSTLFVQSHNIYHSELAWILNCIARLGWLNRMTQFKEKAAKNRENHSVGLYVYPNLQAADILLYDANFVPVGEDQKQHIELCRDIAQKFNNDYNCGCFTLPEPMIIKSIARIMSLQEGSKKMSKSDPSELSKIMFSDSNDEIIKKIAKAKTDSQAFPNSKEELEKRLEVANLIGIYAFCRKITFEEVINQWQGQGFKNFKEELAQLLVNLVEPIRKKQQEYLNDKDYLINQLQIGANKAKEIAENKMKKIKEVVGFIK